MIRQVESVQELRGLGQGRTAAVIGGGVSLPRDLDAVPQDAVLIGINQHANLLKPDFVVFTDPPVLELVKDVGAVLVSGKKFEGCAWASRFVDYGFSGPDGVQLAELMGFDRIVLCGIDCYSGERRYWFDLQTTKPRQEQVQQGMEIWARVRKDLKHPERVRAVSGPLAEVFGRWEMPTPYREGI